MNQFAIRNLLVAVGAFAMASAIVPSDASAQAFWEAMFNNSGGGSGRQAIKISKRYSKGTIIVSFGDKRLYYIHRRGEAMSYPVAIPTGDASWSGNSNISMKKVNPSWTPTAKMRRENPKLPAFVPGGHPRNPLGVRALYLGQTLYRIHGTDAPWTIGTAVSHGCIRMYNEDVLDLYPRVKIGAPVIVTWKGIRSKQFAAVISSKRKRTRR
ncbi:putative L,D-transpeptidase YbiS [bacterium MnTg02]|nr:putative L,D-transpeptidase YbiS [bacterium MnTg02]